MLVFCVFCVVFCLSSCLCLVCAFSVFLICLVSCIFQREPTWMALYCLIVLMCHYESTHSWTKVDAKTRIWLFQAIAFTKWGGVRSSGLSNEARGSFKVIANYTIQYIMYDFLLCLVVTVALSCTIFEVFDFKKYLEISLFKLYHNMTDGRQPGP